MELTVFEAWNHLLDLEDLTLNQWRAVAIALDQAGSQSFIEAIDRRIAQSPQGGETILMAPKDQVLRLIF